MGVKRNLEDTDISDQKDKFTEDEAALYDRQIRLWGMECQKRIREAHILVIGLNGVGAEVVKNLTLSGVKSITILDDTEVSALDRTAQFFAAASDEGIKRSEASVSAIEELNPNVKVIVATGDPNEKPETFFADYDAVFASGCPVDVLIKIDKICREHSVQFYCADTWGFFGYCFLDLKLHKFKNIINKPVPRNTKRTQNEEKEKIIRDEEFKYSSLACTLLTKVGEGLRKRASKIFILLHIVNHFREMFNRYPLPDSRDSDIEELKKIKDKVCSNLGYDASKVTDDLLSCLFGELSPVCAVVGGVLANEMIKGISRTGLPVYNYFLFDGIESVGVNETIL